MSYITDAQKGLEAVEKKQWDEAIRLLSRGLEHSENASWLLARSQAYQEKKQYEFALDDADHALISATTRQHGKVREQLALGQYRRAVILGHLKRYADADACCVWSQQLLEGKNFRRELDDVATNVDADGNYLATAEDALSTSTMPVDKGAAMSGQAAGGNKGGAEWSRAFVWRSMMLKAMAKLPMGDPGRKVTVKPIPDKPAKRELKPVEKTTSSEAADKDFGVSTTRTLTPVQDATKWATKKLRVDFYQKPDTVNLVLYAKGADKDKVQVDVHESKIHLSNLPEATIGSTWAVLDLDGKVDTSEKTIRITPFKIELTLKKNPPGAKWAVWGTQREKGSSESLTVATNATDPATDVAKEKKETTAVVSTAATPAVSVETKPTASKPAGPPSYPSSSRTGPKDWAKMDLGDDDDDQSDINGFFKKLYANSTPEQQRAMAKSFIESNGTSLSTDWNSVSSGPVPTQPPEGVEAKKW